jgi:dCMP deaminase
MKQKLKEAYMTTAETFAELSHARRLHVGAIVVKDDRIISIGYNGMPAGWDNNCEDIVFVSENEAKDYNTMVAEGYTFGVDKDTAGWVKSVTKPEVLHAETNAIAKLAKSTESGDRAVLFVTHSPCLDCSKLIYQSGISSVFYRNSYRDDSGIKFLQASGITVEQIV